MRVAEDQNRLPFPGSAIPEVILDWDKERGQGCQEGIISPKRKQKKQSIGTEKDDYVQRRPISWGFYAGELDCSVQFI